MYIRMKDRIPFTDKIRVRFSSGVLWGRLVLTNDRVLWNAGRVSIGNTIITYVQLKWRKVNFYLRRRYGVRRCRFSSSCV